MSVASVRRCGRAPARACSYQLIDRRIPLTHRHRRSRTRTRFRIRNIALAEGLPLPPHQPPHGCLRRTPQAVKGTPSAHRESACQTAGRPGSRLVHRGRLTDRRGPHNAVRQHVQVQNVWVTSPGDSIVGINTNYGDTARFSGITIYGDADADIDICTKYKGVTSGEPTKIGTGADGTNCIYSPSDITYVD
ncbi:pectate lyase [Streptomyces sp. NPDC005091]